MLVDLRWLGQGNPGGLETVAYCFVERLLARRELMSEEVSVTLIVPTALSNGFRAVAPASVTLISCDSLTSDFRRIVRALTRGRWGRVVRAEEYDVIYTMNGRLLPESSSAASVVMVSDLQHLVHPEFFEPREQELRRAASVAVARGASHIITISDFSRQEIIRLLGVSGSRVSCVRLAADPVFDKRPTAAERDRVLRRYGLKGESYFLLPAQLWQHKNHETVLAALALLADAGPEAPLLVSTGANTSPFARGLMSRVSRGPLATRVRFLGVCPQQDLPALYAGAEALVFCSRYEGFGMPLVEAMKTGCPIIASNTTSLPEVAGDAALLVDPTNAAAIAAAMVRLREEAGLRELLVAAGEARVAQFSWGHHCDEVFALLLACSGIQTTPVAASDNGRVDLRGVSVESTRAAWFGAVAYPRLRRWLVDTMRAGRQR